MSGLEQPGSSREDGYQGPGVGWFWAPHGLLLKPSVFRRFQGDVWHVGVEEGGGAQPFGSTLSIT